MNMSIEPKWQDVEEGALLWPGDEVRQENGQYLPFKVQWGWRATGPDKYRRQVFQQVNIPWLERKIAEVKAKLVTEVSREKFQYQVQAYWASLGNNMQLLCESYTQMADIEARQASITRAMEQRATDLESTQTA